MGGMRAILVVVIVAVGLAVGAYFVLRPSDDEPEAVKPPLMPAGDTVSDVPVPAGFLMADAKSTRSVEDQGLRWERAEGADLPTLLNPCGRTLVSEADRVGGRQVALVSPRLFKSERVVVYRDVAAAAAAMVERRAALSQCANHSEPDGTHTVWRWEHLPIGEEAMFVAGQRMRGDRGLPGHHRAILVRQGRVIVMFVDFGQARSIAGRSEVAPYERDAATMADKLRAVDWS
jgi:hypothetical protein